MYLIGAGGVARNVISILPYGLITGVMDSNPSKFGSSFCCFNVEPVDEKVIKEKGIPVILTFSDEKIESLLDANEIIWFNCIGRTSKNIFFKENISRRVLSEYFSRFLFDFSLKSNLKFVENAFEFRSHPFSESNRILIDLMKKGDENSVNDYLNEYYSSCSLIEMLDDEYFDYRWGMQLAAEILKFKSANSKTYSLCDIACGHGQFIEHMKREGISCYGVELSDSRVLSCTNSGLAVYSGTTVNTTMKSSFFDCVTCFECLEHVFDLKGTILELHRILKNDGLLVISVPYDCKCESDTHVRVFNENSIYSVLCGYFEIENILLIPYVYGNGCNNIFVVAKNISDCTCHGALQKTD